MLDNDEVIIEGVRFLGTTLWTDFMLFGEGAKRVAAMQEAVAFMRDFSRIRVDETPGALFTPDDAAALFNVDAEWLASKLAESQPGLPPQTALGATAAPSTIKQLVLSLNWLAE